MMRKSQEIIFWKDHRVILFTENKIWKRIYGKRFPKTAQEVINESP